jgi:hypothetical protein
LTLGADTHQVVYSYEWKFYIMLCVYYVHSVVNVNVIVHLLKVTTSAWCLTDFCEYSCAVMSLDFILPD